MKILIALSTYNRPIITDLCLKNLQEVRNNETRLIIYDDGSDAYSTQYLDSFCDEVIRFKKCGGIERSRARAFRDFIYRYNDFDLLYLTDNDTIHDPIFTKVLRDFFSTNINEYPSPLPVGLYNSYFHRKKIISQNENFSIYSTCPGVSMCYSRPMAAKIVSFLNRDPLAESTYGWDFKWPKVLKVPFLVPTLSYLEHFARDRHEAGIHSKNSGNQLQDAMSDFDRDRALNPTNYLIERRLKVIETILGS